MCDLKEPGMFADSLDEQRWYWYESLFVKGKDKTAIGEASTAYTYNSSFSAPRIAKHLPDAKLIYITRDPLMRMESHWMQVCRNINQRDLHLRRWYFNQRIIQDCVYIEVSKYWKHISAYRKYFRDLGSWCCS